MKIKASITLLVLFFASTAYAIETADSAEDTPLSTGSTGKVPLEEGDQLPEGGPHVPQKRDSEVLEPSGTSELIGKAKAELQAFHKDFQVFEFSYHLNYIAGVPFEYGAYAWQAAADVDIDPYILAALLISEESGRLMDFSVEAAPAQTYKFDYHPTTEGSGGERGIYQIKPRWAAKAGKFYGEEWTADDLWDPWFNTRAAAYLVVQLSENHKKSCTRKKDKLHELRVNINGKTKNLDFISHYKCTRKARNVANPRARCRFAQKKFEKLFISLYSTEKPDMKAIGKAHNERKLGLEEKLRQKELRRLRHKLRDAREDLGYEIKYKEQIKKMTAHEIKNELDELGWEY